MSRNPIARPTRREVLIRSAWATFLATGLETPGVVFAQSVVTRTPGETQGPYWLDTATNRSDVRSDSNGAAVQAGFQLNLSINVSRLSGTLVSPVSSAKVDIWHCGSTGLYSGFSTGSNQGQAGHDYLRGNQLTNGRGNANFLTVYPGWYSGRTPHIHFRVRTYNGTTVTYNFVSQLFFDETITAQVYALAPYSTRPNRDTTNATDMVYTGASQGNGGTVASEAGSYTLLRLAKNTASAIANFNVVL